MSQEEQNIACNRAPFVTDSSCNRGDVDTEQFAKFPICEVISPPIPDFVQPPFDFPVIPFTPPPCACIDIDLSGGGKAERRGDIKVDFDFKAEGDCCEGKYKGDLDITVPCIPFSLVVNGKRLTEGAAGGDGDASDDRGSGSGSTEVEIDIEEVSCGELPTGTFDLGLNVSECEITIDPKVRLSLPRPPNINIEGDSDIAIEYTCDSIGAAGITVDSIGSGSCDKNYKISGKIKIPYPKFTLGTGGSGSNNVKIDMLCTSESSAFGGTLKLTGGVDASGSDCTKITITPSLDLRIPTPKTYKFSDSGDVNIEPVDFSCVDHEDRKNKLTFSVESSGCTKTVTPKLELYVPCLPFEVMSSNQDVNVRFQDPDDSLGGNIKTEFVKREDCCTFAVKPTLNLVIPYPEPTILGLPPIRVDKFGRGKSAVWVVSIDEGGSESDGESEGSGSHPGGCCDGETLEIDVVTGISLTENGLVGHKTKLSFVKGCFVGHKAAEDDIIPITPHINKCCGDA